MRNHIVNNLSSALCKLFRACQSVRQSLKSFQTLSDTQVWVSDFHSERDCLHAIRNLGWALYDLFRVCQISHLDCHTAKVRLSTSTDIRNQNLYIRCTAPTDPTSQIPNIEKLQLSVVCWYQLSDTKCQKPDTRIWISDTRTQISDARFRSLIPNIRNIRSEIS